VGRGVDLTADRAGFVTAQRPRARQRDDQGRRRGSSAVPQKERLRELVLYATSEEYFSIDS
jgi:hypothetical protein